MDMSMFKQVAESTGLRGTELAIIFEVDRRTVYDWTRGVEPRQSSLHRLLVIGTGALERATTGGVLPFAKDVRGAERRKRVRQMAAIIRKLAAA